MPSGWRVFGWRRYISWPTRLAIPEKITINLGYVDLGHIDLLVREGFYSNRTDLIRTAIRNQLATHSDAIKQSVGRNTLELGLRSFTREDLEAVRAARRQAEHPCRRTRDHRPGRFSRARTGNDRVNHRSRGASGDPVRKGGPFRSNGLKQPSVVNGNDCSN